MPTVLLLFRPLPIAESRTGKPAMVALKIQLDCSAVRDMTVWAKIFVRSHLGCGTDSVFIHFCKFHKYFKDAKAMKINRILKISLIWHVKFNLPPCFSNLVILTWTGLELSRGQASDWHTDGQTDAGKDNTRWPYWPRVINPSSSFRDMGSKKSGPRAAWFDKFLAHGPAHMGQMGPPACLNCDNTPPARRVLTSSTQQRNTWVQYFKTKNLQIRGDSTENKLNPVQFLIYYNVQFA